MSTLDQLLLLEQKVESAVKKIQQLQAENDALRSKCAELTNALSAKSEQLDSFATDKGRIETGIQKALERLNSIENSMLQSGDSGAFFSSEQAPKPVSNPQPAIPSPEPEQETSIPEIDVPQPVLNVDPEPEEQTKPVMEDFSNQTTITQDFNSMENLEDDENQQESDFGFDIF